MGRVIQYVSQPKKTMDEEGNRYLTGVNCVADVAMQSFMATKHLYGEDTGHLLLPVHPVFAPRRDPYSCPSPSDRAGIGGAILPWL